MDIREILEKIEKGIVYHKGSNIFHKLSVTRNSQGRTVIEPYVALIRDDDKYMIGSDTTSGYECYQISEKDAALCMFFDEIDLRSFFEMKQGENILRVLNSLSNDDKNKLIKMKKVVCGDASNIEIDNTLQRILIDIKSKCKNLNDAAGLILDMDIDDIYKISATRISSKIFGVDYNNTKNVVKFGRKYLSIMISSIWEYV